MTREEHRQYSREYRAEGFGRINDRRYYRAHRDTILAKQRIRDAMRRAKRLKLSQEREKSEDNP